jgi:hypothetical protein
MEKNFKTILKEINFSQTGRFEPAKIAKCIQAVEDKDERRIIANAIIGDHAKWLVHKTRYTHSTNEGGAGLKDVAAHILRSNAGQYANYAGGITPLIWQPLGCQSLEQFCYEAADSDVNYDNDLPF